MVPLTGGGAPEIVLSGPLLVALLIAAAAGAVSFFSPCCLPLVPGYLSYVAGISGGEHRPARNVGVVPMDEPRIARWRAVKHHPRLRRPCSLPRRERPRSRTVAGAVLFVGGFAVIFTSYGVLFGALGAWLILIRASWCASSVWSRSCSV